MLVVGATGYIGKYVVKELVRRGYDVVALAREQSGIGGKASREDVQRVLPPACTLGLCGRWQCGNGAHGHSWAFVVRELG